MPITSDVTVDTVRIYWIVNPASIDLSGWNEKENNNTHSYYKAYNKHLRFYFTLEYKLLVIEFSVSSLINSCNAIPYEYYQYDQLKETIEKAVFETTFTKLLLCNAKVSRIDIARSLEFKSYSDAEVFIKSLNNIPYLGRVINYKKPEGIYEYRGLKCGEIFKAYIKNDDQKIPKDIRDSLKPTVRIEIECKKRAKAKDIIKKYNAEYILKNPEIWSEIYNQTLSRFNLDRVILPKVSFDSVIEGVLRTRYPNAREKTIQKYMEIVMGVMNGNKPDHKALQLCRILMNAGVLPICSDSVDTLLSTKIISQETVFLYYVLKNRKNKNTNKSYCSPRRIINKQKSILDVVAILDSS